MAKTIFITGASRGFGKLWAAAFLRRGDNVVATSRNVAGLQDLADAYGATFLPLALDITNRAQCQHAIGQAHAHFGRLDVVINNAGYGLIGAVEEVGEQDVRDALDANLLGTLWVTQAALPILRAQGQGHIIQLSSVLGMVSAPAMGIYSATKFAVEGLSEALAREVAGFGIRVTLVEPNVFKTDFGGSSAVQSPTLAAYDQIKASLWALPAFDPANYGSPEATVPIIQQLIDSDNPPLRLFMGRAAYPWVEQAYHERLASWQQWQPVAEAAHG
ncbi:SDR family NAD(P)-dependent oxidoreductase [Hymenobacter cellulosilyticus]|uniref:SDR family NAD(P)-dependent oxidoreductase n=1 Tax=Hymenobacter cellulosilyticus TaxID=2932248 RepID=A0A8T9Q354_9BACT|nr:SDR family NAD(P)-dependent oxidoreductase [Hymenobacter cellulosilyticus]UOQ71465.1 SDR family NAD(P)-dependent oxidoreductase [Hymenobacter cellulosilyticus]